MLLHRKFQMFYFFIWMLLQMRFTYISATEGKLNFPARVYFFNFLFNTLVIIYLKNNPTKYFYAETTNCQQQQNHAVQHSDWDDKTGSIVRPGENLFETIRKRMFKMLPNYQKPWRPRHAIFDRSQAKRKMKELIHSLTAVQKKYVATLGKMQVI